MTSDDSDMIDINTSGGGDRTTTSRSQDDEDGNVQCK